MHGIHLTPVRYFYCPSQVIFLSIIIMYSALLHLILFLSRFSFHGSVHHCAPEKNISQCHPDSASNMPQLLAINQQVQTRVYKHESCLRFLQDYQKYFFRLHACHSKFSGYLLHIAKQKYKVYVECAACRWFTALKSRSHFILSLSASLHLLRVYLKSMASNNWINLTLKECYRYEAGN